VLPALFREPIASGFVAPRRCRCANFFGSLRASALVPHTQRSSMPSTWWHNEQELLCVAKKHSGQSADEDLYTTPSDNLVIERFIVPAWQLSRQHHCCQTWSLRHDIPLNSTRSSTTDELFYISTHSITNSPFTRQKECIQCVWKQAKWQSIEEDFLLALYSSTLPSTMQ